MFGFINDFCSWMDGTATATPKARRKQRANLNLERLETRETPAVYTWKAGAEGNWEDNANWDVPVGTAPGYPRTEDDTARFDSASSSHNAKISTADVAIGKLEVIGGFEGEIKLFKSLTLKDSSRIESAARIAPQNTEANLVVDGTGDLKVSKGMVGSTTHKSQLKVTDGGKISFTLTGGAILGMDVVLSGGGQMTIEDGNDRFDGVHLTMTNGAGIKVNKSSILWAWGKNGDAWMLAGGGGATGFIDIDGGQMSRETDRGEQQIALPVLVRNAGELSVFRGSTLNITSNGTAATAHASLNATSGGTVRFDNNGAAARLVVADDVVFNGGKLHVAASNSVLRANRVTFKGGAELTSPANEYSTLHIELFGPAAKVAVLDAKWTMDVAGGMAGNDRVLIYDGELELGLGSELALRQAGAFAPGNAYGMIATVGGSISGDFATKPSGRSAPVAATVFDPALGAWIYQLTF